MDQQLFLLIHGLAGKSRLLDFLGIFTAEYFGYVLVAAAIFFIISLENWRVRTYQFLFAFLAVLLSRGILTEAIRFFYFRPRPFVVLGIRPLIEQVDKSAFPSGHAAFYFALAGAIFLMDRRFGWYLFGGASFIGLARVFVGVHWPLDIVGGAVIAVLAVFVVKLLLASYQPARSIRGSDERKLLD